jgi:ribosomal protein L40E
MELGHDVKAALNIYMQTLDVIGFTTTLKNTKVALPALQDPNGMNVFHDIADCVVRESYLTQYLEILVSEFNDRYFDDAGELVRSMLNHSAGRDRLTPLMCAVKHNRKVPSTQKLLKEMIALGGDICKKNALGQNLVHIAASNGFDAIMVYLCKEKDMSYVETEINGRTPLHLAALENQTSTGLVLVNWSPDLNQQDMEKFTALHLAVLSQSYKIVRNLIIMGADHSIEDNKGETALDIALNRGDSAIIKLLVRHMQQPPGCLARLNPFRQRVGPVSNGYSRMVLFILVSLFREGFIISAFLPHLDMYVAAPAVGLFLIGAVGFLVASCKNPGYTNNPKNYSLLEFFEMYRSEYICVYCVARKPRHARHCHYCGRCVKVGDR